MPRYIAFLRAINVSGHTVKMERLRQIFIALGFAEVETFIASGNVIFTTRTQNTAALQSKISVELQKALGYEVATFIRTAAELAQIAAYKAFPPAEIATAAALNILFLPNQLDASAWQTLTALTTAVDRFATHDREVYWLCRKNQSESTFSNAVLERKLRIKATLRSATTVTKMAAKYGQHPVP